MDVGSLVARGSVCLCSSQGFELATFAAQMVCCHKQRPLADKDAGPWVVEEAQNSKYGRYTCRRLREVGISLPPGGWLQYNSVATPPSLPANVEVSVKNKMFLISYFIVLLSG